MFVFARVLLAIAGGEWMATENEWLSRTRDLMNSGSRWMDGMINWMVGCRVSLFCGNCNNDDATALIMAMMRMVTI